MEEENQLVIIYEYWKIVLDFIFFGLLETFQFHKHFFLQEKKGKRAVSYTHLTLPTILLV